MLILLRCLLFLLLSILCVSINIYFVLRVNRVHSLIAFNVHNNRQQKKIELAKDMYKDAIEIREDVCKENKLIFFQSYYNTERLEKYQRSFYCSSSLGDLKLRRFGETDKACQEKAIIYKKIAEVYKFLENNEKYLSFNDEFSKECKKVDGKDEEEINKIYEEIYTIQPPLTTQNHISNTSPQPKISQSGSGKTIFPADR